MQTSVGLMLSDVGGDIVKTASAPSTGPHRSGRSTELSIVGVPVRAGEVSAPNAGIVKLTANAGTSTAPAPTKAIDDPAPTSDALAKDAVG